MGNHLQYSTPGPPRKFAFGSNKRGSVGPLRGPQTLRFPCFAAAADEPQARCGASGCGLLLYLMIPTLATRFGFLYEPFSMSVAAVRIEPLPDYGERSAWYKASSNADGFFYPPQMALYTRKSDSAKARKLPRTTRPARVYNLPASHAIEISAPIEQNQPYSDANFLIQVLAFIFGTRLQFEEWRLDGRVPTTSVLNVFVDNATCAHFVEYMYLWWRTLPPDLRTRAVNLFYAFNRASAAEMDWDALHQQYMVFDGLFCFHKCLKLALERTPTPVLKRDSKKPSHEGRFDIMCSAYGIQPNKEVVKIIYKARNNFFHEAMWAGGMVGYGTTEPGASQYSRSLSRLNARLLCAIAGYKNVYTASVWWAMGGFLFDQSAG